MVTGRVICPVSANGAPDCKAASDTLCQAKGFKEGKSLTSDSAETCSAKVLIPAAPASRTIAGPIIMSPAHCASDTGISSDAAIFCGAPLAKGAIALFA